MKGISPGLKRVRKAVPKPSRAFKLRTREPRQVVKARLKRVRYE